jgi:hypothetical protein
MGKWYEDYSNIVLLARWMVEHGRTAQNVADMVEKPWHWYAEYGAAKWQAQQEAAAAS